jgi:tetratricopeptide (TPR) repeat protein
VALVLGVAGAVGGLFLWQTEEHRREQQAAKHLTDLQRSAEDGEAFALAELRAGRYTGAEKILQHALDAVHDEPKLEANRSRLETRLQRTRGLVDFYRLADKAEKLAFLESDAEALAACESALVSLGILHDPEWAVHLPAADLTNPADADPEHLLRQVREDVYRTIGLLAALYVRPVMMKGTDDPETQQACRAALKTVERFHRFRPSVSGRLIELFCYLRLGQLHRVLAWKPVAEPTSATDYYFSGMAYVWLAAAEKDDGIRRFLELPVTRALIGLDFRKAQQTSERYLRTAADREPRHYWTQFWLAWSFSVAGNFAAAAQAYDTCVALRPDYALAYAQRGQVLVLQMPQTTDADRRLELERRGLADLSRAQTLEPDEPFIHWLRAGALAYLERVPEALEAFGRAMELERPLAEWKGQHIVQEKQQLLQQAADFAKAVTAREPGQVDAWAVLAAAQLALGQTAEAQTAASRALQLRADHARALAVKRALQLQKR